ncbi:hypothetical protein P8935_22015 [Telmatobacter sp. DSM 110680]|uniref:HTH marR-type domain-containing protein n=1 Tax=Telmatobacter sp. DSM 110680 TaxID=3036704 RepID=A0AAU7DHV6_9BACT
MERPLPLSTLLSQILVAFTIEFDNEAERRMPHSTTAHGRSSLSGMPAPWLVSMVMWFNCMQHVGDEPISIKELEHRARTPTNFDGMQRWGYINVENPSTKTAVSGRKTQLRRSGSMITATPAGQAAKKIWRPLFLVIEDRWRDRFGSPEITALREASLVIVKHLDPRLPDCLPILKYGLFCAGPLANASSANPTDIANLHLPSLLSKLLLSIALEFESESPVSLAICANVLRQLNAEGVRIRDLPTLSGVSKEALKMAMGILVKRRLALLANDEKASLWKVTRLTSAGLELQGKYLQQLGAIEERWQSRFGKAAIQTLREAAQTVTGADGSDGLLLRSIEPYAEGWRAAVVRPSTLPHFPMVLHRGGYPDGS